MEQSEQARKIVATALKQALKAERKENRAGALAVVAKAHAKVGKREEAQRIIETTFKDAQQIDDLYDQALVLLELEEAAKLAESKQVQEISAVAAEAFRGVLALDPFEDEELFELGVNAERQAEAGSFDAAVQVASRIWMPNKRVETLAAIARVQARGDEQRARRTFAAALRATELIGNRQERARAVRLTAEAQLEAGYGDAARVTLSHVCGNRACVSRSD